MAQIVPKSNFAAELGTGIGTGLSRLAENKIAQLQQRQQAAKFQNFVEDQQTADWLQTLQPQDQLKALQWLQASNTPAAQQFQQQLQPARQQVQELAAPEELQTSSRPFLQQLGGVPHNLQVQQQQQLPQNLFQQQQLANQLRAQQEQAGLAQQAMQQQRQAQLETQSSNLPSLRKALSARAARPSAQPQNIKLSKTQEGYVKGYDTAAESINILNRMEELLNTGNVKSGVYGNVPLFAQNAESQEFAQLGDTLAGLLVSQYGTPTNAKIKFTQGQKPQLTQDARVQRQGIERLRREAMERMNISRQRLPEGYFGEEIPMARQIERQSESAAQREPEKVEDTIVSRIAKESPDTLNWFAKKALEEEQQGLKEEGWLDYFIRNIQRGGAKAQESIFGKQETPEEGFERIEKLTGGKHKFSPEQKSAIKNLEKKNELLMEPKNFTEKVSDRMFESLPLIGLTGIKGAGNIGKALLQDLGASTASTAVEEAGGGAGSQFIASLAGGSAARRLITKAGSTKNLISIAKDAEKNAYEKSRELGKNINVEGRDYKKKLSDIHEALQETSSIDFKDKEIPLSKFNQWVGDASPSKVNANKILERKNEIDSLIDKSSEELKPFYIKAKDVMVDQLNKIGSHHKDFNSSWKRSEYLDNALKYPEQFKQMMADIPYVGKYLKNPLAYALASGAQGLYKGKSVEAALSSAAKGLAVGVPLAGAAKAIEIGVPKVKLLSQLVMAQDPKIRELTLDVMRNVIENNKGNLQRSLIKLNKATEPYAELL